MALRIQHGNNMWKSPVAHYASSPHLFVYGAVAGPGAGSTGPASDSGYTDSSQSASSATPEPIYYCASEITRERPLTPNYETIMTLTNHISALAVDDRVPVEQPDCLGDHEIRQLETFYKGHKTHVFVCKSLANLYLRSSRTLLGLTRYSSQPDICRTSQERQVDTVSNWELRYTGVPVILHDLGKTKSRDRRRIQIVLAERGTGFALWRDTIDNLSNYEAAASAFHTMRVSTDHRLIVGFSFDSAEAARQFYDRLDRLTSDPANICLSLPKKDQKRRFGRLWSFRVQPNASGNADAKKKRKSLRKSDISLPCFFQHVTAVDVDDQQKFYSLQAFAV